MRAGSLTAGPHTPKVGSSKGVHTEARKLGMGLKPQKGLTNICYFLLGGLQASLAKVSEVVDPPLLCILWENIVIYSNETSL